MPEEFLRVRDWDALYENNRTRGYKKLNWVPIPNRMDGDGYTELVDHTSGAAHLGAWIAIVQVASRCEPRGVLQRDGGRPHDADSLARMTRLPVEIFREVIPRLLDIKWLEISQGSDVALQGAAAIRQDAAEILQDTAGSNGAHVASNQTVDTVNVSADMQGAAEILQDAAEIRQFKYAERNGTEQNRTIESSRGENLHMLITAERTERAKVEIGAHRRRGDQPDETIVRKILIQLEDDATLTAWLKSLADVDPGSITASGYGWYLSDVQRWIANGCRRPARRKARKSSPPMKPFDVSKITGKSPYFDITTITGGAR